MDRMTHLDPRPSSRVLSRTPAVLTPEDQAAVRFLGSLVQVRLGAAATAGQLAILEHQGERGYGSPRHLHQADEETFFVLEGELRFETGSDVSHAGAGSVAFLPRQLAHAFVVTSAQARFLTVHTPAGFDEFTVAAAELGEPGPAALGALARTFGIDITGPPPVLTSGGAR